MPNVVKTIIRKRRKRMKIESLQHVDYSGLPESLRGSMKRYLEYGIDPGSFLTAVIENNLSDSFATADENNRIILFDIVQWFYSKAPMQCWKSRENRIAWQEEQNKNRGGRIMTEKKTCRVEITSLEWKIIKDQEAVVIEEYETVDGSRFGRLHTWGTLNNMLEMAQKSEMIIILNNIKIIGKFCVPIKDLNGPKE